MKKRFLGIVCFVYVFIILYAYFSGILKNFLAPNMQIYIKLSVLPMLIIGFVLCINNKINYKFKYSDLVLLLPLLMIFFSGDGNLTMSLANARVVPLSNRGNAQKVDSDYEIVDNNEIIEKIDSFYFDIKDSTYSYLASYITFMQGAKKFAGETIRLRGFTIDYSDYLNDGYFALGKYSVTCCAADAELALFVVRANTSNIKQNTWYEVEGILEEAIDSEGYSIMAVRAVSIKEIDGKGEEQYVYPCNTYGNGKCEDLHKYDLEY